MESLNPRVRLAWLVAALVPGGVILAVGLVAQRVGAPVPPAAAAAVAVVVVALGVAAAFVRYRVWRFEIREDSLYLVRGVLTRVDSSVPYVRVQHVDTRRGPSSGRSGSPPSSSTRPDRAAPTSPSPG